MNTTVRFPVSNFCPMANPYFDPNLPRKWRFFVKIKDVPSELLDWMRTNPREQNLRSDVAKAIAASLRENSHEFFIRNRGILLSANSLYFSPYTDDGLSGEVKLELTDEAVHGNIDGGHTMRIILDAQKELGDDIPDEYVEMEVITGLKSAITIAEARNASVALDVKSLEEMKGSYAVLKEVFQDWALDGNQWFDRVELKMNQMNGTGNAIDIRFLISILLMFNQDLYPVCPEDTINTPYPTQMYGGKESALKKYLSLGGGTAEGRDAALRRMAPIMRDIIALWDLIERDLSQENAKAFSKYSFASRRKEQKAVFSEAGLACTLPQALVYPVLSAFRILVGIDSNGNYYWQSDPFTLWTTVKKSMSTYLLNDLRSFKGNVNNVVKSLQTWRGLQLIVTVENAHSMLQKGASGT